VVVASQQFPTRGSGIQCREAGTWLDSRAEEEIGERGHAAALRHVERRIEEGGPVRVAPHRGRRRTGPGVPAATRERRRGALVGRCPLPCGSRGASGARGLCASVWAGQGKE
jgi:hypothetical protein